MTNTTTAATPILDFMSLDDLLADAMSAVSNAAKLKTEAASVRAARKTLASSASQLNTTDRDLLKAIVASWEITREWTATANTAMFDVQQCNCGSHHSHFTGFFQQQEHRHSKISRWIQAPSSSDLPKNRKENCTDVGICGDCAATQGWGK